MRVLQSFTRERAAQQNFREVSDALPRLEHADGRPERRLLPVRRLPLVGGDRRRARLRRLARLPRRDLDRHARRVPRLPVELLRPGAAALAALQHVPLRGRGARQDHRPARRGARGRRRAGRRRARRRSPGDVALRGRALRLRPRPRGAARRRPRRARRARRSRSSATRAQASRRSRSCSPASTTRPRAASRSTASTCATRRRRRCAASSGSSRRRASSSPARVAENIAFGRPAPTARTSIAAARAVGADEFIERLEDGYETQLGERGSRLSLGQRQLSRSRGRCSPTRGS